jgi:hypothetical protein
MIKRSPLLYVILVVASRGAGLAQEQSINDACTQFLLGTGGEYTLKIPTQQKEVTVHISNRDPQEKLNFSKAPDGSWQAGIDVGRLIVPLALRSAFTNNANGEVVVELSAWGHRKTNSWHFSSIGPAEAIYALRCLAPERKWAEQLADKLPKTKYVAPLSGDRRKDIMNIAHEINLSDPDLLKLIDDSFNDHRAEMLAQFGRATLFYPRAELLQWNYRQTAGEIYAISSCSDRLYSATFIVRIDRKKEGDWFFRQMYAYEWFKGE